MNLGAMLHLIGKLREAEEEYLRAWTLSVPSNLHKSNLNTAEHGEHLAAQNTIKTNLKRLHNIMESKGMAIKNPNGLDN